MMKHLVFTIFSAALLAGCGNSGGEPMTDSQRQDMFAAGNAAMIVVGTAR